MKNRRGRSRREYGHIRLLGGRVMGYLAIGVVILFAILCDCSTREKTKTTNTTRK